MIIDDNNDKGYGTVLTTIMMTKIVMLTKINSNSNGNDENYDIHNNYIDDEADNNKFSKVMIIIILMIK